MGGMGEPAQPSIEEAVSLLAEQLGEADKRVHKQLHHLVKLLGVERSLAFLERTLATEAEGGMMLPDGSRRRTPGGVFFFLVRTQGPPEVQILWQRKRRQTLGGNGSQPAVAATASLLWEERMALLRRVGAQKGSVSTVKITLIGRPGTVEQRGQCIVTTMQSSRMPALPKGLPTPPSASTTYTVYILGKQWRRVEEAIRDPDDALILDGYPFLDGQSGTIAVFVLSATTRTLQAAQRQATSQRAGAGQDPA
jgi:PHAX RNA-binding domain